MGIGFDERDVSNFAEAMMQIAIPHSPVSF
jgi:hypothetical protein